MRLSVVDLMQTMRTMAACSQVWHMGRAGGVFRNWGLPDWGSCFKGILRFRGLGVPQFRQPPYETSSQWRALCQDPQAASLNPKP